MVPLFEIRKYGFECRNLPHQQEGYVRSSTRKKPYILTTSP